MAHFNHLEAPLEWVTHAPNDAMDVVSSIIIKATPGRRRRLEQTTPATFLRLLKRLPKRTALERRYSDSQTTVSLGGVVVA